VDESFANRLDLDGFLAYSVYLRHGAFLATLFITGGDGSTTPLDAGLVEAVTRRAAACLQAPLPR